MPDILLANLQNNTTKIIHRIPRSVGLTATLLSIIKEFFDSIGLPHIGYILSLGYTCTIYPKYQYYLFQSQLQ
jgi:hypothetical protein